MKLKEKVITKKTILLLLLMLITGLLIICCNKKIDQKTDRQTMYESYPKPKSSKVSFRDVDFYPGKIGDSDLQMLRSLNSWQIFIERSDAFQIDKYKQYFKDDYQALTEKEKALVGDWWEWESVSKVQSSLIVNANNGSDMIFLPNHKLLIIYERYEKSFPLIAILCKWEISNSRLQYKTENVVYMNRNEIVNEKNTSEEWMTLYENINDIDFENGYTYYGFNNIAIDKRYLGEFQGKLVPDKRRATSFLWELDYSAYELITFSEMSDSIYLQKDISEDCIDILNTRK